MSQLFISVLQRESGLSEMPFRSAATMASGCGTKALMNFTPPQKHCSLHAWRLYWVSTLSSPAQKAWIRARLSWAFCLPLTCKYSITRVVNLDAIEGDAVKVTRLLDYGYREQVRSLKPLVVAFEALEVPICRPSFAALVHASDYPIPCLDLSQTGIPRQALQKIEARLAFGPPRFPVPRMQFVQPPDSSLPAFDRRRQLAETSAAKRERKVIVGEEDSVAESLFQTLLEQGWLDHLRDKSTKD